MSLRQIAYFVAVAEELHFARAASRLYVAAPSLSQQIAALERSLGVRLFERHSRKVELTEAGAALLPQAERLLADADRLRRDAAALRGAERRRPLVVGLRPGGFGPLTGALLDAARAALPDVELVVRPLRFEELGAALPRGRVDVLLTTHGPVAGPRTRFEPISVDGVAAAVPAHSDLAAERTLLAADLRLEPMFADDDLPARLSLPDVSRPPDLGAPATTEELLLRVAHGGEAFAIEASVLARPPEGIAVVALEGVPPVVAGIATSYDDDRPAVAAFRKAAVAVQAHALDVLPSTLAGPRPPDAQRAGSACRSGGRARARRSNPPPAARA